MESERTEIMKIIDRKTFLNLPENTLFSKYEPCCFSDIMIKGETWTHDFLYQDISDAIECSGSDEFSDLCDISEKNQTELKLDFDCQGRDGMFDEDQLFAVWSKDDVKSLVKRLSECL